MDFAWVLSWGNIHITYILTLFDVQFSGIKHIYPDMQSLPPSDSTVVLLFPNANSVPNKPRFLFSLPSVLGTNVLPPISAK